MVRKSPAFTIVVLLTLALGIGANTALFSVVDAVLLRPLPYPEPQQLVAIHDDIPGANLQDAGMSVQELDDLQNGSGIFDQVSAVIPIDANVTGREKPERIEGLGVSPNYFTLLRAKPALGRIFVASDNRPGLFEGVVISDGLWRRMFGGDPAVVGQAVRLDSDLYTIIGVMPPEFRHPGHTLRSDVDVWSCGGYVAPPFPQPPKREIRLFPGAIGSIKSGLTVAQAQAELDAFVAALRRQYPTEYPPFGAVDCATGSAAPGTRREGLCFTFTHIMDCAFLPSTKLPVEIFSSGGLSWRDRRPFSKRHALSRRVFRNCIRD